MKGTEKQINWAEDIKTNAINHCADNYTIIWTDGWKYRLHINTEDALKELETKGFWFDDFCDDGTGDEIWKRG